MYQRIVVPLDGSPLAEAVLPHAVALAQALGAEIHLVEVVPLETELVNMGFMDPGYLGALAIPDMESLTRAMEGRASQANQYLQAKAAELQQQGLRTHTAILRGDPAGQVIQYAGEGDAALITISSHGRSGISRIVFGSVAGKVVRHAGIPVLVITPREKEEST